MRTAIGGYMDKHKQLANVMFPNISHDIHYYRKLYPKREGMVYRFAPSPTGFLHLGTVSTGFINYKLARQNNGACVLRIEDTDKKREVAGGVEQIIDGLAEFGITFTESPGVGGVYAPYKQSERAEIYQTFVKFMVEQGMAYPCFCTEEELAKRSEEQTAQKLTPGYYGKYAIHRGLDIDKAIEQIQAGTPYVVRYKSLGDPEKRVECYDLIKGHLSMPQNNMDIVLLKQDGIPTYHFAHIVDDYLLCTSHVVRGDEWLATLPVHLQLFDALGIIPPLYMHISPLLKMDGNSKRKLSKRKDPEAAVSYYMENGYPKQAVIEYILTLLNSNFELWRKDNPLASIDEFTLAPEKMSVSGALVDMVKLGDISKNIISLMTAEQVYDYCIDWATAYDGELKQLLEDKEKALRIFAIGRGIEKPRKDIAKWNEVKDYIAYFYPQLFDKLTIDEAVWEKYSKDEYAKACELFAQSFDINDDKTQWFDKVKAIAAQMGYAADTKTYKKDPTAYKGHVGDISMYLRLALTKRANSPDLYDVIQVLGSDEVARRMCNNA